MSNLPPSFNESSRVFPSMKREEAQTVSSFSELIVTNDILPISDPPLNPKQNVGWLSLPLLTSLVILFGGVGLMVSTVWVEYPQLLALLLGVGFLVVYSLVALWCGWTIGRYHSKLAVAGSVVNVLSLLVWGGLAFFLFGLT